MHRDTVMRSWGPLLCHSSTTITSCCSMIMRGPCCKDLYTIPGSWKHPSSCMASILTGHVTHWACLGCSESAYDSMFQFLPKSSNLAQPLKRSGPTFNNQQLDQHYVKEICCTAWGTWWSPYTDWYTVKLHILEWPFIVASLRHTCAIIMLSNKHLDMPHLWGGWIISAKEKCSLRSATQI